MIENTQNTPTSNIISDDEKIDTTNLKLGDKVWIEVEVFDVGKEANSFFVYNGDGGYDMYPLSIIKKIIPKND